MPNDPPDPHPSPGPGIAPNPPPNQSRPPRDGSNSNPRNTRPRRPPRGSQQQPQPGGSQAVAGAAVTNTQPRQHRGPPRAPKQPQQQANIAEAYRNAPNTYTASDQIAPGGVPPGSGSTVPAPGHSARRRQFGSKLTTADSSQPEGSQPERPSDTRMPGERGHHPRSRAPKSHAAPAPHVHKEHTDLTSKLIASFARSASNTEDAPDCPICFNTISPGSPTWSCAPSSDDNLHAESGAVTCWTPFHLKCIKEWASKSVKDTGDAFIARGVVNRVGEWRCPGCQTRRSVVPREYRCFCSRIVDPRPGRLATPHSCGEACSRVRTTCAHPCPISCHPGPCPPCVMTVTQQCHCEKQTLSLRCATLSTSNAAPLSCNQPCERGLSCGNHRCERTCHAGPCDACPVVVNNKCYCGRETRDMKCGEGEAKSCELDGSGKWEGRWECEQQCDRPFDCGVHRCQQSCHPPSPKPAHCPRSPDVISTCPCSHSVPLSSLPDPARKSCSDPIPICKNACAKPLPFCSHLCKQVCHEGDCKPCPIEVEERCRCGRIGRRRKCHETTAVATSEDADEVEEEFLCDRKCTAFRGCARHMCGRTCCPLAALSGIEGGGGKGKGKKKEIPTEAELKELDPDGWHICDLICGKPLSCGNHPCTERDHRGPCPRCLQSSFEELVCNCGRTVIEPPVHCGTVVHCPYPCHRPPPACGHPRAPHTCHSDSESCPPCPYLAEKPCACGKTIVKNVRCSITSDKVGCGTKCGKHLDCGFHSCDRPCHPGECGSPCRQTCGKPRKSCSHPCPLPCHAPSACSETSSCPAPVTLHCACGRLSQPSTCGRSATAASTKRVLPCMPECAIAKRNEKLAAALGIDPGRAHGGPNATVQEVKYSEGLISFSKVNSTFLNTAEKALHEFITSDKRMIILPPMPLPRRQFIRGLAEVYRLDGEDVDQEPRRSVQLRRRIDSRIPPTLLSTVIRPPPIASATANSSTTPVKMAWGQKPPPPSNAAAAIAARPSPSNHSAWTAVPARPMSTGPSLGGNVPSRPITPQAGLSGPTGHGAGVPIPMPIARTSSAEEDVPDSWDEIPDS